MTKFDELMQQCERLTTADRDADIIIKVKLKMIRSLLDEIKDSADRVYMEEIVTAFADIMYCQNDVVMGLRSELADELSKASQHNFVANPNATSCKTVDDSTPARMEIPKEGFQNDEQVKKAFSCYLKKHAARNSGKAFTNQTIYDYSSRVKKLSQIICKEWRDRNGDTWFRLDENSLQKGPLLTAYENLPVLQEYLLRKKDLTDNSSDLRQPASPEEAENPLNNPRNLANASAALAKFEAFKNFCIKHQKMAEQA